MNTQESVATSTTKRTHSSEGTQAHNGAANKRANIKYWTHCEGMDRDMAKAKVEAKGYKMMSNEEINRAVKIEAQRQENLRKRAEREAQAKADQEVEDARRAKAQAKWDQDAAKAQAKAEEPKATKSDEPKTIKQGKVGVTVNGVEYPSICKGMAAHGIPDKGTKNWFKIRAALKKVGMIDFEGHIFIQL
jgi:hypothetical protein